jgi:excisionase family DNA binding protein
MNSDSDRLLNINEAANLLQVKPKTFYSWVAKNVVPYRKAGSLLRFHQGDLLAWTVEQAGGKQSKPKNLLRSNSRVVK